MPRVLSNARSWPWAPLADPSAVYLEARIPRWPDLVVPLITVMGTLLGVGLGARWQRRNSLQLFREQSRETWSTRTHPGHEQTMKLFDDKRAAYVRLFAAVDEFAASNSGLWADAELLAGFVMSFELPHYGAEITPEERAARAENEVDEVLAIIELLAPRPVYRAAVTFSTTAMINGPRYSPSTAILSILSAMTSESTRVSRPDGSETACPEALLTLA